MLSMVAAIGLVLAACSSDGGAEQSDATVPGPSSTTTSIDVSRVPDTITVEYAQAVMDELDRLLGDAIRELVAAGVPSDKFVAMLKAVYDEPQYSKEESLYGEDAASGLRSYHRPPGNPKTVVEEIVDSSNTCIVLRANRTFKEVMDIESPGVSAVLQLVPKPADAPLNRTFWRVVADSPADEIQVPENPCGGR